MASTHWTATGRCCYGLTGTAGKAYPVELRCVVALIEVEGESREMVFVTNKLTWSAQTIADLYGCRWNIQVFFKELKQTRQLADFISHNTRRAASSPNAAAPGGRNSRQLNFETGRHYTTSTKV